jgi:hypothetical protein
MLSARTWSDSRTKRVESATVAGLAVWLARPFLRPGRYVVAFDTVNYSVPNHIVTMNAWRSGRLPLWNDMIFGGVPHLGNAQTAALYPARLLTWGLEPTRAINLLAAAHIALFAFGMLALARRLGLGPPIGFVVALVGTASGAMITRSIQFEQICVLAWTPWILAGLHACLTSLRPRRAMALTAGAATLGVLAGHPQSTYMTGVLAAVWVLLVTIEHSSWRRLSYVAGAAGLALAAAALQLVATLSATRESAISSGRSLDELSTPGLSAVPRRLAMILGGTFRSIDPGVNAGSFEAIGYVGSAAAGLALIGVVAHLRPSKNRVLVAGLACSAVVFVVLALGPRTFVFEVLYRVVPGFDLPRVSARWLTMTAMCVAVLAGFGMQAVLTVKRQRPALVALGGASALVGAVVLAGFDTPDRRTAALWILLVLVVAVSVIVSGRGQPRLATALLIGAVVLELGVASLHSVTATTTSRRAASGHPRPTTEFLSAQAGWTISLTDDTAEPQGAIGGLRPNASVQAGVRSLDGYDGGVQVTKRWLALIATVNPEPTFELPLRNQVPIPLVPATAGTLGIRFVQIANDRDAAELVPGWGEPVAADDLFTTYENPRWPGEAFIGTEQFRLVRPSPEQINVASRGEGGTLSIDAQLTAGWRAYIDGQSVPLARLDGFRLAVDVPSGDHEVEFHYRPRWLLPAEVLSIVGLLGICAVWFSDRRRDPPEVAATVATPE